MEEDKTPPLVTMHISAYNHENYIGNSIQSVIDQTYKNLELIIINDGSLDRTHEVILKYIKECQERFVRFKYINRHNKGLCATKNECIKWSQGKYFTGIASDDICDTKKIEILVEQIEPLSKNYALVCGNAEFIDKSGKSLFLEKDGVKYYNLIDYNTSNRDDINFNTEFGLYKSILISNYIPALSVLIRKTALLEVGLYEEELALEDWNMWLKLSKNYKMKYINKTVAYYRWHNSNSVTTMKKRLVNDAIYILKREKVYCIDNKLMPEWRISFYSSIIFLFRNKCYYKFIQNLFKNNIFLFLKHIIKIFIKKLYLKTIHTEKI